MKRTPMKRGKGFRMRDYQKAPESNSAEFEGIKPVESHQVKPLVRGVYGPAQLTAAPKTVEHRNDDLLRLARGRRCLLSIAPQCDGDETVVACHSNMAEHGKSMARKANDEYSVFGCASCHRALDFGQFPAEVKREWFLEAHARQIMEWARIAFDMSEKPKDRRAAEWALKMLHPNQ